MLLLLSNNINKHSSWMLSLEIFWSACAAAADYRQIRCRPSADRQYRRQHPKTFSTNIITLHNSVQVNVKFRVQKEVFIYFIIFICLKRMGLNLSTNLTIFVYTFQAMWRHRPLEEYLVFVGICSAHTSFSPFTLSTWPCTALKTCTQVGIALSLGSARYI